VSQPQPGDGQLYQLRIIVTGEVRDADGNLINQDVGAETTVTVTEQQALAIMKGQQQ